MAISKKKNKKQNISKKKGNNLADKIIDIYQEDGQDLDMSILERSKYGYIKRIILVIFLVACFLGIGFSFLSWYLFTDNVSRQKEDVRFEISGEDKFISGEDVVYIINYANLGSVDLLNSRIDVRYPAGFVLETSIPEPTDNNNVWDINTVAPGKNQQIKIKGRLIGQVGTSKTLTGIFSYTPENFSSEFQEINSFSAVIKGTDMDFSIKGPDEVFVGEPADYVLKYASFLGNDLGGVSFKLELPEGFSVLEANPAMTDVDAYTWDIFGAYKQGEIKFKGMFNKLDSDRFDHPIKASAYFKVGDFDYLQSLQEHNIKLLKSDVSTGLVINGQYNSQSVKPGALLNYKLSLRNDSDAVFNDVKVKLYIKSKADFNNINKDSFQLIDWTSLQMGSDTSFLSESLAGEKNKDVFEVMSLSWGSDQIKDLKEVSPEQEVEMNLSINLYDEGQIRELLNITDLGGFGVESFFEVTVGQTGGRELGTVVRSNVINSRIVSDLSLNARVRYFDDEQTILGAGPLPPRIGQATTYRVDWEIINTVHDLSSVEVSVIIPEYVKWAGKQSLDIGDLSYNFKTRVLKWKINRLPVTTSKVKASFDIILTPLEEQVDQILVLVPKSFVKAIDDYVNQPVNSSSKVLTTNLEGDSLARGKGIVISGDEN